MKGNWATHPVRLLEGSCKTPASCACGIAPDFSESMVGVKSAGTLAHPVRSRKAWYSSFMRMPSERCSVTTFVLRPSSTSSTRGLRCFSSLRLQQTWHQRWTAAH